MRKHDVNKQWARTRHGREAGFSLVELVTIVAILGVMLTITAMFSPRWFSTNVADGGMQQIVKVFRTARERAISDRRNVEVRFIGTNQLQVVRRDVVGIAEVGTTVLETVTLEGTMTFHVPSGVVDLSGADNLVPGMGMNGINRGTATSQIFTSEGTFVDQNGDPLNIEVFIARRTDALTTRVATVFGSSALIRGLKWNGRTWSS